ncbi:MAG TPA: ectonucleotide pyrophosphatase/phosphodiesterase [Planctomicrobium sp.]|nr:ectonucleotide pyrophosphatase/phosphodiesterase [Planctomicrobium sp.]
MIRFTLLAPCFLILLTCWQLPLSAAEPKADHCVVLISVDGLANFYLDDPKAELPTIRKLAAEGARATQGMTSSFPTVTWPNHTTLVTGVPPTKHGVIGNNYLDRTTGKSVPFIPDPLFDKDEIVKSPTVYDVVAEAGLKTAGIIWPATRNAKNLHWTVPDMAGDDAWPKYGTPSWLAELREAGIPIEKHGAWCKESSGGVPRDWLYTRLFSHVVKQHQPNLVLIHLVEVDHVQHKFGPKTPEAYWAVSYADDRVRDIVEAVKNSPNGDRTTIIVASDHGFFPISKDIRVNVAFKELKQANGEPAVKCVSQGGGCMVYILDEDRKVPLQKLIKDRLPLIEGIEEVFTPDQFPKIGQLTPDTDARAPDFWLASRSGYSFTDSTAGDDTVVPRGPGGTHGYMPQHPEMQAMLVIAGAGIRPGTDLGQVSNLDVAPTMAALLGVSMPTADGQVRKEAFKESETKIEK